MRVDLAVIGSGPGGYRAAIAAAHLGAKVALIERAEPGGNCLNRGCIPTKTLVHLASLIEDAEALAGRGLAGELRGDFGAAMSHKDEVVATIRAGFAYWLERLGIAALSGSARFVRGAPDLALSVDTPDGGPPRTIEARRVIVATGSRPRRLRGCATDGSHVLDSRDFLTRLHELPGSVLFVGGGPIGVELGYFAHAFGARVTIAERGDRLLGCSPLSDRAAQALQRKLERIGVEIRFDTGVTAARVDGARVGVTFDDGTGASFDKVVVAVGREPCTEALGLDAAGVELTPGGFIRTSPHLETSAAGVYAIGDAKPGPMTANGALHDAKIAAANAVGGNRLRANYLKVPFVVHSALEIAAVGFDEDTAEEAGFEPDVARSSLRASGKARACHDYEGFIDVVHDAQTGQLLGGCIIGPEAGEQIHMLAAACQSERGMWFFKDMSYSHPSWCEELENAIDPYAAALDRSGRDLFSPGILATS
jgi:dihydrolipoamide dehydrogenase